MKTEIASRSSTRESRISYTAGLAVIVSQSPFDNCASPTRCGNQATLTLKSQISLPQIGYAFHTSADCRCKAASFYESPDLIIGHCSVCPDPAYPTSPGPPIHH